MRTSCSTRITQPKADDRLRALLDHIASELAEEYVRLMEATADEGSLEALAPVPSRQLGGRR